MTTETVEITKGQFHHFVRIQNSGEYNMVDNAVAQIIGIDRDQHMRQTQQTTCKFPQKKLFRPHYSHGPKSVNDAVHTRYFKDGRF
jgi:hypothetical protein